MKNKALLFALSLFFCGVAAAQTIYEDAISLAQKNKNFSTASNDDIATVASILGRYLPSQLLNKQDALQTIANFKAHNPFIRGYFAHTDSSKITTIPFEVRYRMGGANPGQLDVTNIADGLAKFLVNRTKEELAVAFLSTLKQDFEDKKYAALQTLFPLTFGQLELIGNKVYQFSAYLNELRSAFMADLGNLTTTLPYVLALPQYQHYFGDRPWVAGTIQTGFFIGSELVTQKDSSQQFMGDIIKNVAAKADDYFPVSSGNATSANIHGTIKTLGLLSASLSTSTFGNAPWIKGTDFFTLVNDSDAFKIYLGLLYQRSDISFAGGFTLTKLLDSVAAKATAIEAFKNTLSALMLQMNICDNEKQVLDTMAEDNDELPTHYYAYFNTGTDILQHGLSFLKSVYDASGITMPAPFLDKVDQYVSTLHDAGNVYLNIHQHKFAPAISAAVDFLSAVMADMSANDKNVAKLLQRISTYGTFIAEVANAKTSNEVDSIITQTVLPTGSSYIKKHSRFNIAAQAYTGLYGGQQKQATDTKYVGAAGVYAPIGVAFSWGLPAKNKANASGSFSIFASVVDLGPLVSFRFSNYNDSIANNVKVRLSQIVSPGLHLVYGLPKLPLSFGVGCNWAPLITNVESGAINANTTNAFRYQAFIAVDIPLLNFYNNPR